MTEIKCGDKVVFKDGTFASFIEFEVFDIKDGLLFLDCKGFYRIGNIKPEQVEVVG